MNISVARPYARRTEPTRAITIRVPESLYVELHVLMCDPRSGLMRYGTFGRTVEAVLRAWIDAQKIHTVDRRAS